MADSLAKHKGVEEPHIDVGSAGRHSSLIIFKTLQPENLSCATNCLPSGQVFQPKTGQRRDFMQFNKMQQSIPVMGSPRRPMDLGKTKPFMCPTPFLEGATNPALGQSRDPMGFNQMQQDNKYGSMTNIGSPTGPMSSVHPGRFMTPPPPLPASSTNLTFGKVEKPSYNEAVNMRSIREESSKKNDIPGLSRRVKVVEDHESNTSNLNSIMRSKGRNESVKAFIHEG